MDKFAQTLQSAGSYTPDLGNPLGASHAGVIQGANAAKFQVGAGAGALSAFSTHQAEVAAAAQAAAEQARQEKIAQAKANAQAAQDALDGKNYKQQLKPDGGYDYYDPLGNKISLQQYTQAVGKQPEAVLKDSNNALDQQYLQDKQNLSNLLNVVNSGNKDALDKLIKAHPELQGIDKVPGAGEMLTKQFISAYPNVYGDYRDVNAANRGSVRNPGVPLYNAPQQQKQGNFAERLPVVGGFLKSLGL